MKLSDYVMQRVAEQGVKHVFFVPGGGAMHLNDSLGRCPGVEYVSNLHEQASSIAAEAYSRVTNQLGVAMVTTGPGGTNAVTGVAGAWLDSTPCLFLSGQVKRPDLKGDSGLRQLGVQEIDIVTIVQSITKYAVTVTEPETIRYHLEKAFYLANHGRRGPVWVDIPLDVQAAEVDPETMRGFEPEITAQDIVDGLRNTLQTDVARTLELLQNAERPVILVGNGVRMANAQREFVELAEALQIPVLTTWLGLDLLHDSHPLHFGKPGSIAPRGANFTVQNADFLLTVGARLDLATVGYSHERFARAAQKVVVDIDPAELAKIPSAITVPVIADAGDFLREMLRQSKELPKRDRTSWLERCREWKAKYPLLLPEHLEGNRVSAYGFSRLLSDAIAPDDLIVPGSSGFASEIFFLMLQIKPGQRCFHNRGTGAMGFAIPSALGACMAAGRKHTISVDGDGGFQFNIQELHTIAHLNLPIKFFVVNNAGYSSIRVSQGNYFDGHLVGCDASSGLPMPDTFKIAQAYGLTAERIDHPSQLKDTIARVLAAPGPVVCEVVVQPDEQRVPRLSSYKREDGSMASKPLEDLWPFLDRDEFNANMLIPVIEE
jgi:acetolactate synthase-1/2/3 large subunit